MPSLKKPKMPTMNMKKPRMPSLPKLKKKNKEDDDAPFDENDELDKMPDPEVSLETVETDPTLSADQDDEGEEEESDPTSDQLDNHFANEPDDPIAQSYTAAGASLPTAGEIMGRVTLNKMATKNWQELAWYKLNDTTILFFKCNQDFQDWQHRTREPHLYTDEQRDQLVKKKIDFLDDMLQQNVRGYTLSKVEAKSYTGNDQLYQFKLECWMSLGPMTCAAFGSEKKEVAEVTRAVLNDMYIRAYDQVKHTKGDMIYPVAKPDEANASFT